MIESAYTCFESPIGRLTLCVEGGALVAIYLPGQRDTPRGADAPAWPLSEVLRQLEDYFAGRRHDFQLPLAPRGTAFQRAVWDEVARIPFGATTSYAAIARALGRPRAVRAVGAANGRNPLPIVVPCHRVVGSNGALTGYAGGLDVKRWLLAHEAAVTRSVSAARAAHS